MSKRSARTSWLTGVMGVAAAGLAGMPPAEAVGPACSLTAHAAFVGCQHEVEDDYWIAIGNCRNLSDDAASAACKREAVAARGESRTECAEQRQARLEVCEALGEAPYDPQIDPARFVDPARIGNGVAPNPFFPLVRGTTWIYRGGDETVTVTVTGNTRIILGVTVAEVRDLVEADGEVTEDTKDWYAQDIDGNVWYFGEISLNFEDGELADIEGSWTAGVEGAKPGMIMKAVPAVGDVYRQEFALGDAEDMAEVLSLTGAGAVPAASCNGGCLVTRDFTPLEPGVEEHKYYVPGIGLILEVDIETGERLELVEIQP